MFCSDNQTRYPLFSQVIPYFEYDTSFKLGDFKTWIAYANGDYHKKELFCSRNGQTARLRYHDRPGTHKYMTIEDNIPDILELLMLLKKFSK